MPFREFTAPEEGKSERVPNQDLSRIGIRSKKGGPNSRLTLIAELNHHVRNALTTIVLYAEHPDLKQRLQSTTEAVDRIEWVLRDLVPTAALQDGKPRLLSKER